MYKNIAEVKDTNRAIGQHFFDRETMKFFNSVIESALYGGRYFITSERYWTHDGKEYSIRIAFDDGSIGTIGKFQAYESLEDARNAIREIARQTRKQALQHAIGYVWQKSMQS